jgi:hypothetical protein
MFSDESKNHLGFADVTPDRQGGVTRRFQVLQRNHRRQKESKDIASLQFTNTTGRSSQLGTFSPAVAHRHRRRFDVPNCAV